MATLREVPEGDEDNYVNFEYGMFQRLFHATGGNEETPMTDMHDSANLEQLYGPLWAYSDNKVGEHIDYFDTLLGELSGRIIWVAAPQRIAGTQTSVQYIVEPDRGGFPDIVTPSDLIISRK